MADPASTTATSDEHQKAAPNANPTNDTSNYGSIEMHDNQTSDGDLEVEFRNFLATKDIKKEEIVLITRSAKTGGRMYHVWALKENPDNDQEPFRLVETNVELLPETILSKCYLDSSRDTRHASNLLRHNEQLHFVISTHSGLRLALPFWSTVLKPLLKDLELSEENGGYNVVVTQHNCSVSDFAKEVLATKPSEQKSYTATVVLLSGDGGVADFLNGLGDGQEENEANDESEHPHRKRRQVTVGLMPLGTANALFHSLHKEEGQENPPSAFVLALRTLFKGRPKGLPTFRAEFSAGAILSGPPAAADDEEDGGKEDKISMLAPSLEPNLSVDHLFGTIVASYGFHASLVWESDTPAYRKHGDKRFGMAAQELLRLSHAYNAIVEVKPNGQGEWKKLYGEGKPLTYALATMVSNLEKTFTISPDSKPLDGQLRLVHFREVGGENTMDIMKAAYNDGRHVEMPEVGYEDVEEVKVTIAEKDARWRKVCIDGTIVEIAEGGWMKVKREPKGERLSILMV